MGGRRDRASLNAWIGKDRRYVSKRRDVQGLGQAFGSAANGIHHGRERTGFGKRSTDILAHWPQPTNATRTLIL